MGISIGRTTEKVRSIRTDYRLKKQERNIKYENAFQRKFCERLMTSRLAETTLTFTKKESIWHPENDFTGPFSS